MYTNRLDLETLGFWLIMPKKTLDMRIDFNVNDI